MKIRSRSADLIFKFTHKDLHTKLISKFKFVGHLLSEEIPSDPMLKLLSSGSREISLKASCWVSPPYASKTPAPRAFSSTARSGSPSRPPLRPPPRNHVAVFVCRPPRARPLRPRRYAPSPSGSFLAWRALTSGWMACGGRERKGRATMGRARCPPEIAALCRRDWPPVGSSRLSSPVSWPLLCLLVRSASSPVARRRLWEARLVRDRRSFGPRPPPGPPLLRLSDGRGPSRGRAPPFASPSPRGEGRGRRPPDGEGGGSGTPVP